MANFIKTKAFFRGIYLYTAMNFWLIDTLNPHKSRFLRARKWLRIWKSRIWVPAYVVKGANVGMKFLKSPN